MKSEEESDVVPLQSEIIDDLKSNELKSPYHEPSEFEVQANYLLSGYPGIMAAGCVYPFFISILITLYWCVVRLQFDIGDLGDAMSTIFAFSIMGGALGLFISVFSGMVSIGLVIFMNWSLGFPFNARFASLSAGSLAGYMPTVWVLFTPNFARELETAAAIGLLGPILAMSLGAYGSAFASRHNSNLRPEFVHRESKLSVSISNLMIATAWISVVFAIGNALGGLEFAVATAGWFGIQAMVFVSIYYRRQTGGEVPTTD